MALKDDILSDIDSVFLNTDDFAGEHEINGISVICVVDDDRLLERTDKAIQGTYLGEKLLFVKASDLPGRPAIDSRLTLDGKPWYVRTCIENMGMLEIRLEASKS